MLLQILGLWLVQDVMFSSYHFFIDCFELIPYERFGYDDISFSIKHHNYPHLRGYDTPLAIFKMSIGATLGQIVTIVAWNAIAWLLESSTITSLSLVNLTAFIWINAVFTFVNHKYVHSAQPTPRLLKWAQNLHLINDREYHSVHHANEDGKHLGFMVGFIDYPLHLCYTHIPEYWRALVPLTIMAVGCEVSRKIIMF